MKSNLPIDEALYEQGYNQAIKDLDDFNWSSFRREVAKDLLCAIVAREAPQRSFGSRNIQLLAYEAVEWADELIRQLKEEKK